jgi:peptidoglycan hydrolase-like protein with peptidoglycan-binding domain
VVCEDQIKDTKILSVQKALAQEGFDPGQIDGVYNESTQQALRAYQRAKGLPEGGGMTIETLEALGVYE